MSRVGSPAKEETISTGSDRLPPSFSERNSPGEPNGFQAFAPFFLACLRMSADMIRLPPKATIRAPSIA